MYQTILRSVFTSITYALALLALWAAQSTVSVAQTIPQALEEQRVDVGGHRLHFKIVRSDKSAAFTIVLESGGGMDSSQWKELQPRLALETSANVVSYDRAGFGQSDLPDTPYDIVAEVESLHTALRKLQLEERLLLVGHSFGGLLSQMYAYRYSHNVKGILFVDPNSPSAILALGGAAALSPPKANPSTQRERAFARIDRAGIEPFVAAYRSPLPPKLPIVVLSAEKGLFPTPRQNQAFRLSHELLAASVEQGNLVVAMQSGHNIPAQRPDLVVESVSKLIAKAAE